MTPVFSATRLFRTLARVTASVCCPLVALALIPTADLLAAEISSTGYHKKALKKPSRKSYGKVRTYWDPRRKGMMMYQGNMLISDGPYQEPNARPASLQELMDFTPAERDAVLGPVNANIQNYSSKVMWDPHRKGTVVFQGHTLIDEGPFMHPHARSAAPQLIDVAAAESNGITRNSGRLPRSPK